MKSNKNMTSRCAVGRSFRKTRTLFNRCAEWFEFWMDTEKNSGHIHCMGNDERTCFISFFRILHYWTGDSPPNILLLVGAFSTESKGVGLNNIESAQCILTLNWCLVQFSLKEQPSLFSLEGSFDQSSVGLVTGECLLLLTINEAHLFLN